MSGRCSLTLISRLLGRSFLARTRWLYLPRHRKLPLLARCSEKCFGECTETRTELTRNPARPRLLSIPAAARSRGWPKPRSVALAKSHQAIARYLGPSAELPEDEGHWDQSIAYFEQALALDPRNLELLMETAATYAMLSTIPGRAQAVRSTAGYYAERSGRSMAAKGCRFIKPRVTCQKPPGCYQK